MAPAASIAVLGAGVAGLAAARGLAASGLPVAIYEKSRGLGGRLATRRSDNGTFDHGAQFFTARDRDFKAHVDAAIVAGAVAEWLTVSRARGEPCYVGTPGMSSFARYLANGLAVDHVCEVTGIDEQARGVRLDFADGTHTHHDRLIVAIPYPQAAERLGWLAAAAGSVDIDPCAAAMVAFAAPVATPATILEPATGPIAWAACDSDKPLRGAGSNWVIHATLEASRPAMDWDKDAIAEMLVAAFANAVGTDLPAMTYRAGHRWRYARTRTAAGTAYLASPGGRVLVCGDWCLGARVEAAWCSGRAAAAAITS